jgi:hypothetical protein
MRIVIEGDSSKTKEEWKESLGLEASEWVELIERAVFAPVANNRFSLKFVGAITTRRHCIIAVPKYHSRRSGSARVEDAKLLIEVLRRYFDRSDQQAVKTQETRIPVFMDSSFFSEYEAFLGLRQWYNSHGVYRTETRADATGFNRRINWSKTLATTLALHSPDSTIYPRPVSVGSTGLTNIVSEIQISALAFLSRKYEIENPYVVAAEHAKSFASISVDDLIERREQWIQHIQREMGSTFRTDTLAMLAALRGFLEELEGLSGPTSTHLFGTSSFHVVWEDACSVAVENDVDRLKHLLSQPVWEFFLPAQRLHGGKQRPDIIWENNNTILFADAKYYYPLPESRCGWSDIVKQYMYLDSLSNPDGKELINVLLFPDLDVSKPTIIGRIQMERAEIVDDRFKAVWIAKINPNSLLLTYVRPASSQILAATLISNIRACERTELAEP